MTTSTSTPSQARVRYNRVAAVGAWSIGVFFSYLFLARMVPTIGAFAALAMAAGLQALLTLTERPLWRWIARRKSGRFVLTAAIATAFDAAINAGGMYPFMPRLSQTDLGKMLIEVFSLSPNVSAPAAALIAFILGMLVAGAPEALWEYD